MFADRGGVGRGSACPKKDKKKNEKREKKKKEDDLFGVLMLLFYFYTGVYGGDHDEAHSGSLCNNFRVECN